jgi:hypothetical protein
MIVIATAHTSSSAPPAAFFARWADVDTWPEWNSDTEWVRLDGPFATGSTGVLKPKGGPKVKFVIDSLVPGREFVDVSLLAGARLTFRHLVEAGPKDGTRIEVAVTMDGPLGWFWNRVLGQGLKASLQPDLDRLVTAAESAGEAVAPGPGGDVRGTSPSGGSPA